MLQFVLIIPSVLTEGILFLDLKIEILNMKFQILNFKSILCNLTFVSAHFEFPSSLLYGFELFDNKWLCVAVEALFSKKSLRGSIQLI